MKLIRAWCDAQRKSSPCAVLYAFSHKINIENLSQHAPAECKYASVVWGVKEVCNNSSHYTEQLKIHTKNAEIVNSIRQCSINVMQHKTKS